MLGNGIRVSGRIDLIRRRDTDEVVVIDFKSNDRTQPEEVTDLQLRVYALGYNQGAGQEASAVVVTNLDNLYGDRQLPVTEESLEEARAAGPARCGSIACHATFQRTRGARRRRSAARRVDAAISSFFCRDPGRATATVNPLAPCARPAPVVLRSKMTGAANGPCEDVIPARVLVAETATPPAPGPATAIPGGAYWPLKSARAAGKLRRAAGWQATAHDADNSEETPGPA